MVGYEVITSDEKKVGRVAEIVGDNLVVEHGTLLKSRHALPKAFAHADDSAHVVRVTVPKEILLDSPKVGSGGVDANAVAAHYGLAGTDTGPPTRGYGDEVAGDPAYGADTQGEALGLEPAEQRRAEIREGLDGRGEVPESPALLGDRTKQVPRG
jgi:hypothetical protein